MRSIIALSALMTLILSNSCTKTSDRKTDADGEFEKLAEEFIAGYLAWRPEEGTALGLHEYDGKLTDYSAESLQKENERLNDFEKRIQAIDTSSLSSRNSYDYLILNASIKKELFRFDDVKVYKRNPMVYAGAIDVNIYISRDFAPLEDRLRSVISIERQAPDVMRAAVSNLDDSLPMPYVQTAIQIAKGSADFLGGQLVTALKDVKNDSLMARFREANETAISELKAFADYLKKKKLPAANNKFALGTENFKKMMREGELVDLSPEKILEAGMKELRRTQEMFAETSKKIDPSKKPVEVYKDIQKDHPSPESLIPDTKKNLEAIRQFLLDRKIITVPSEVRVNVKEMPEYARALGFASMDTPGPFETKATEAYYYVTPVEPDWTPEQKEQWLTSFNYYTTDVVSIHEAYPGHYFQFLHLNSSSANKVEKIFGSYAFTEGWAHYSEQMMLDEGFGADKDSVTAAKYRLAQLDEALLRLCRLCVSIKMHCEGMSVEEAIRFFQENCYYEYQPARSEAIRGTYDPGYLNYTLGKLMILKLREDYKKQEGSGYSLKKFNDAILNSGMPPVPVLRMILLKDRSIHRDII